FPRTIFQGRDQIHRLQCFRAQSGNASTRLLMAVAHQVAGEVELLMDGGDIARHSIANGLELKAESGKALREGVVHFVREPLAFFENGTQFPALGAAVDEMSDERQQEKDEPDGDDMARSPPGRPGDDLDVSRRAQQQYKRSEIAREIRVNAADSAHAKQAVGLESAEEQLAASLVNNGAKGLVSIIQIKDKLVPCAVVFTSQPSFNFNEGR